MYGIFQIDVAILNDPAYNKNILNEHNEVHSEVFWYKNFWMLSDFMEGF